MRVAVVAALLIGALAAPARADTEPLPASTTISPRDGQSWTASSWPVATPFEMRSFVVYASDYDELPGAFAFAVAESSETGQDGLLAHPIDGYTGAAQPDRPGIYVAQTSLGARWLGTPGTYYWQASYADDDDVYASPVRTLTVIPPPPPDEPAPAVPTLPVPAPRPVAEPRPPDASTVRIAVRRAIHAATHMVPRGLVYRCARTPGAATCRPSWHDGRARYHGTLQLSFAASPITASFKGTRAARGRAHRVTWATSL